MTLEEFVEYVTEATGFCVLAAVASKDGKTVRIAFDTEVDGEGAVEPLPRGEDRDSRSDLSETT